MEDILGNLTEAQKTILKQLRKNLEDILTPDHTDYALVKYLRAKNFNLKESEKIFRVNFNNRITFGINTLLETYEMPEVAKRYESVGILGFAKDGTLIHYTASGRIDLYVIEMGTDFMSLVQDCYPEIWHNVLIINAPGIFHKAFNAFKPILRTHTLEKIYVADKSSSRDLLLKYIDEDVLPAFLGGKKVDSTGDPMCKEFISFGGKIPEEYYSERQRIPLSPTDPDVKCIYIRPRSMYNLSIPIRESGLRLRIQFRTENGNITITVFFKELDLDNNNKEEFPAEDEYLDETTENFKYKQISVVIRGQSQCTQEDCTIITSPGIYILRLSNAGSWFTPRKLFLKYELFKQESVS